MKYLLITYIALFCNILLASGNGHHHTKHTKNIDITKSISLDSIVDDINDFYSHNVKAQTALNPGQDTNNAETDSSTGNTTGGTTGGTTGSTTGGNTGGDNSSTTGGNTTSGNTTGENTTSGNTTGGNTTGNNTTGNNTTGGDKEGNGETKERECVSNRGTLGSIVFVRPISKSILVINSNFTIRWRYDTKDGFDYNFPQNTITFKLYHKDDANLNSGDVSQWKNHIYEKTIPLSDVELGPVVTGGFQTYQYNWYIVPGKDNGYRQTLTPFQQYKLRIYADGKDDHTNQGNFPCYSDGDLQAGTTMAFNVVDNKYINSAKYSKSPKIDIPDDARMSTNMSLILSIIIAIILIIFNNY